MNWKNIVSELSEMGVTQHQIAAACGVSQAAISDLKVGNVQEPRYAFGSALVALHTKHSRRRVKQVSATTTTAD